MPTRSSHSFWFESKQTWHRTFHVENLNPNEKAYSSDKLKKTAYASHAVHSNAVIHTTGRFSTATGTSTIIVANREWSDSHTNVSRLCSSVGWHRNESLCMKSKEKTQCALKILRFFRHFSTTRTYLSDNRERERGPIVSVGVDPTGTFWWRFATFHVNDQINVSR